jgi:hypothetical protein
MMALRARGLEGIWEEDAPEGFQIGHEGVAAV